MKPIQHTEKGDVTEKSVRDYHTRAMAWPSIEETLLIIATTKVNSSTSPHCNVTNSELAYLILLKKIQ